MTLIWATNYEAPCYTIFCSLLLFIYGLLNGTFSTSDYIVLNDKMIGV
jgi:hypothetical protein